jgi:hypothetical protein
MFSWPGLGASAIINLEMSGEWEVGSNIHFSGIFDGATGGKCLFIRMGTIARNYWGISLSARAG